MHRMLIAAFAASFVGMIMQPTQAALPPTSPFVSADTVHVAPPTGVRDADRANILAALAQVPPGGSVQFAPGTYVVGRMIRVSRPRVTLHGHPEGTTLRGCNPDEFVSRDFAIEHCNGLELAGERQSVRNLTFEYAFYALALGCCFSDRVAYRGHGGHLVEGNTFRNSSSGVRVMGDWSEPAVIRNNRFINNWHSVAIDGRTAHVLDNDISAPEPEQVPFTGVPSDAVRMSPPPPFYGDEEAYIRTCTHNVVAGNRIDGITDGIHIAVAEPGTSCRHNVIRDNTIAVRRTRSHSPEGFTLSDEGDSTFIGVPLALLNYAEAFRRAGLTWTGYGSGWSRSAQPGSAGAPGRESAIEDNLIEGNRIIGAEGTGMEILHSARNRIVNNTITRVTRRDPFPGNVFDRRPIVEVPLGWGEANGSGIWISPGSEENEIVGNTFADIAAHAIVVEGDGNVVEIRSAADAVHDLRADNQVRGPDGPVSSDP